MMRFILVSLMLVTLSDTGLPACVSGVESD